MENTHFILLFYLFYLLVQLLETLLHELGHTVPIILLTNNKVSIYIGSFGDATKSLKISLGKLTFYVKYNPLLWNRGLCVPHTPNISINKQILYTATGPLMSLLSAGVAAYLFFTSDVNGFAQIALFAFMVVSMGSFIYNAIPTNKPIILYNGGVTYNDGYTIKQLLKYRSLPPAFFEMATAYHDGAYEVAAQISESLLAQGLKNKDIFIIAIDAYKQTKEREKVKQKIAEFQKKYKLNADDYSFLGNIQSQLGEYTSALAAYEKGLRIKLYDENILCNRGFTFLIMRKYKAAIEDFDRAITVDDSCAYAYANRGLAKIQLQQTEDGLKDIHYALEINELEAYAHRSLGIYYLENEDKATALQHFQKAKELNKAVHQIEELINDAQV